MKINVEIGDTNYKVKMPGECIAIPLNFNGPQPNTYGVPHAESNAFEGGGFVGDTRRGGGCNFETYQFTPHCNGTHTECIGHISLERIPVHQILEESLVPSTLISVQLKKAPGTHDHYDPVLNEGDLIIDLDALKDALQTTEKSFLKALIIRTLPNDDSKMSRDYSLQSPAFFTLEAMQYIHDLGVTHLLLDMPSVDRLFDEGKLNAHRIFWGWEPGRNELGDEKNVKTITEMIYVKDHISDGKYLLDLQIAAFMSDASPSRPVIYELEKIN